MAMVKKAFKKLNSKVKLKLKKLTGILCKKLIPDKYLEQLEDTTENHQKSLFGMYWLRVIFDTKLGKLFIKIMKILIIVYMVYGRGAYNLYKD